VGGNGAGGGKVWVVMGPGGGAGLRCFGSRSG
jgi:hypothetical protein